MDNKITNYFEHCDTLHEVKLTFRALAKKHHPDKNKDAGAKALFQEIEDQRAKKIKQILRASGMTDAEIERDLASFLDNYLEGGGKQGARELATKMGKEFYEANPDKEPSFLDVMKYVTEKVMDSLNKKNLRDAGPANKLDQQKSNNSGKKSDHKKK